MSASDLIPTAVTALGVKLNWKPNEVVAFTGLAQALYNVIQVEAVNKGVPIVLADLAKSHPQFAATIEAIPEVKAILTGA